MSEKRNHRPGEIDREPHRRPDELVRRERFRPGGISRRELLRTAGVAGAAAAVGVTDMATATGGPPAVGASPPAPALRPAGALQAPVAQPGREPSEHLTATEAELLEAIADHLIPSDALGPGAREARAVRYIDRALGGALADFLESYRAGLAAFDRYCRSSRGGGFSSLAPADRIGVLTEVETGGAPTAGSGFPAGSTAFFAMIRTHVLQGTFGDPYYGGNASFVGWDLIGYPGVRTAVTATDQQRLEADELRPYRRSAYDWANFEKATVDADDDDGAGRQGGRHAD